MCFSNVLLIPSSKWHTLSDKRVSHVLMVKWPADLSNKQKCINLAWLQLFPGTGRATYASPPAWR